MSRSVVRFPVERRRAPRTGTAMANPRVVDAALLQQAAVVLEAELRDVRRRARVLETSHGLILEAIRGSRGAA